MQDELDSAERQISLAELKSSIYVQSGFNSDYIVSGRDGFVYVTKYSNHDRSRLVLPFSARHATEFAEALLAKSKEAEL